MQAYRFKRAIVWLICAALMLSWLPVIATSYPFVGYTTDDLRMRKQPSTTADILLVIPKGEALLISGADGSFYIVEYEGRSGYAMKSFITLNDPAPGAAATPVPASQEALSRYVQLKSGDTGQLVRALQEALKELNYYDGAIDGKYGSGTSGAVRSFQQRNSLPANGVADPITQEKLFEGTSVNAFGRTTGIQTLPINDSVIMRPGSRGELVSALQQQLQALGLYKGAIDGRYGSGTESAVRSFQQANGLRADGIAGVNTRQALVRVSSQTPPPNPGAPAVTQSPTFSGEEAAADYPYSTTATASVNMRKRASISSARMLTVPSGATVSVLETQGDFLKVTYRNYTGYVMAVYVDIPPQYLPGDTLPYDAEAQTRYERLAVGSEGIKVRALQQALQELGFFQGTADSKYGTQTLASVKAFQKQNGLRETGVVTPEIQKLLYEERCRNARNQRVYVATLPPVEGWPMQQGDRGDAVVTLQEQLQQLGHYTGTVSSEYTRATTNAVRAFQKAHSIKETGKVDSFTLLALRTALATPMPQPDGFWTPAPTALTAENVIIIRSGTRGLAVTQLQERLQQLGYYEKLITPDGVYNADDIAALRAFQRNNGLTITGIADLGTQVSLYAATAVAAQGAATAAPVTTPAPTIANDYPITLRIGMSGEAVRAMQTRLITLRFLSGSADGAFGTQTAAAVSAFQRANNLKADGLAGKMTLTALYAPDAKPFTTPAPAQTPSPTLEEDKPTLRVGDTGDDVRAMQQRLIQLGYLAGGADGIFGPKTSLAVRSFQTNNKLTGTGIADDITLARMNLSGAVAATGVVAPPQPSAPPISAGGFKAPAASEVRFADWYAETRSRIRSMPNVIIYDFTSRAHYNVKVFSVGRHADGEPVTKQDTDIMENAFGYNNWTPRPVWVIFSDGRVYMASTHSHGHEVDHNSNNGLTGHICIHFPRSMEDAVATGPYAVSHQNAIMAGWDLTMNMAR